MWFETNKMQKLNQTIFFFFLPSRNYSTLLRSGLDISLNYSFLTNSPFHAWLSLLVFFAAKITLMIICLVYLRKRRQKVLSSSCIDRRLFFIYIQRSNLNVQVFSVLVQPRPYDFLLRRIFAFFWTLSAHHLSCMFSFLSAPIFCFSFIVFFDSINQLATPDN